MKRNDNGQVVRADGSIDWQSTREMEDWDMVQQMPPVRGKMPKFTQVSAEVVIKVRIGTSSQMLTLSEANALNASLEAAIHNAGLMERSVYGIGGN